MSTYFQNPYLPHALRDGLGRRTKRSHGIAVDRVGLPVGTAAQVMQWVGDDPDRALRFLAKEQAETRPRVSLVANLKAVLKRHEIQAVEIVETVEPRQLAPQIDVVPAERAIIAGEVVADDPVDQLALIREKLGVDPT